jgi:hypothetical protein
LLTVVSVPRGRHLPVEDYRNTPEDLGELADLPGETGCA